MNVTSVQPSKKELFFKEHAAKFALQLPSQDEVDECFQRAIKQVKKEFFFKAHEAKFALQLPSRREVHECYQRAMLSPGVVMLRQTVLPTVVAKSIPTTFSPASYDENCSPSISPGNDLSKMGCSDGLLNSPNLTACCIQDTEVLSPQIFASEQEGIRIYQIAMARFPGIDRLNPVDHAIRLLVQGESETEQMKLMAAINAVRPNDVASVLAAVLWFKKSCPSCEEKIALIDNFAAIPPKARAFIAEIAMDDRDGTARIAKQMLTKTKGISWQVIIDRLEKLSKETRHSFLVCLYGLSPFMNTERACVELFDTLANIRPSQRIEVVCLASQEMTQQMNLGLMKKVIQTIAAIPSYWRRPVIERARLWIKNEPNNFRIAEAIEAIAQIRTSCKEEILTIASCFHPDYALEIGKAISAISCFDREFVCRCVEGFTSAQESFLVLDFLKSFESTTEDAREAIKSLLLKGRFGYYFAIPCEESAFWRWTLIKAITNIPQNQHQERLIKQVTALIAEDKRGRALNVFKLLQNQD